MDKQLQAQINSWVKKVGKKAAVKALVQQGFSPSTAYAIARNAYRSNPKGLYLEAISRALEAS